MHIIVALYGVISKARMLNASLSIPLKRLWISTTRFKLKDRTYLPNECWQQHLRKWGIVGTILIAMNIRKG